MVQKIKIYIVKFKTNSKTILEVNDKRIFIYSVKPRRKE